MFVRRTNPWGRSRRKSLSVWPWVLIIIIFGLMSRGNVTVPSIWSWISPSDVLKMAVPVLLFEAPNTPVDAPRGRIDDSLRNPGTKTSPQTAWVGGIGVDNLNQILENQIPVLAEGTNRIDGRQIKTALSQTYESTSRGGAAPPSFNDEQGNLIIEKEGEDFPDVDIPREDPRREPPPDIPGVNTQAVLVYHTHNAETYAATDGKSRLDGKNAGVFKAGTQLVRRLQDKYKIQTIHSDTIHDFPSYDLAYNQSQKTITELLRQHPNPLAILDIHRDAVPKGETVTIGGRKVARILFIVGTNARAPHPRWKQNFQFAETVAAKLEDLYPGVSKGIMTKEGRYHQQMHPRALLVEIGSDKNSTPEALAAAEILADALAKVLRENLLITPSGRHL